MLPFSRRNNHKKKNARQFSKGGRTHIESIDLRTFSGISKKLNTKKCFFPIKMVRKITWVSRRNYAGQVGKTPLRESSEPWGKNVTSYVHFLFNVTLNSLRVMKPKKLNLFPRFLVRSHEFIVIIRRGKDSACHTEWREKEVDIFAKLADSLLSP